MNKRNIVLIKKYLKEIYINDNKKSIIAIIIFSLIKVGVVLIAPFYTMKILDEAIPEHDVYKVGIFISIVLLSTVIESCLEIKLAWIYSKLSKKVYIFFQKKCITHMFCLNGSFYSNMSIGNSFTTIMNDVSKIKSIVSSTFFEFIYDVAVAIVMLIFLSYLQYQLVLIILCILPIIYFSQSYQQKKGHEYSEKLRASYGKFNGVLENMIANTLACILCNGKNYFFHKYDTIVNETTEEEVNLQMVYAKNGGVLNFLSALFTILILGFGGMGVIKGVLTIGGLIAFNLYAQKLVIPLLKISNVLMELQSMIISMERVDEFLHEPEVKEENNAIGVGITQKDNSLVFENVKFSYVNEHIILKDITLNFKSNTVNVIVGESGCGKSTLLSLIYRLWDTKDGIIKINDYNARDYSITYLRDNITIISQEVYLFDDTIFSNIVLDTNPNIDLVYKCAKIACIHDYIMSLPDKYETVIGEKGVKLSGGERQRICIARALIRNTPILIFDEATSALDQLTEKQIMDNIMKEIRGKIVIMITHRLQSISESAVIYVMRNGKIEAKGKHSDLINNSVYYKKLYERDIILEGQEVIEYECKN